MPAMKPIRVLVVDDSVTVRQLLVDALSADPEIHVVGTAPNGALGMTLLPRLVPDVVVLDIDMPVMDGLEFLRRVRPAWPKLPIIVFSTYTTHGAATTPIVRPMNNAPAAPLALPPAQRMTAVGGCSW